MAHRDRLHPRNTAQTGRRLRQRLSSRTGHAIKWLVPGLFVKRWLLLSTLGIVLTILGIAIWVDLTPIYYLLQFVSDTLGAIATVIPNHVSGPIAIALGLLLIVWGQTRTVGSIADVLKPEDDEELVDVLLAHRRRNRGPKIVAVGGGTGLSALLRGLKTYSANITAIVTVADDGGSSGQLRRENNIPPPGDIRSCLAALADEEKLLTELFQYRFSAGSSLTGHSFGNLFLTAMNDIAGDLERAIDASSRVLAVRGRVVPATFSDMTLWARMADGRYVEGESNITHAQGTIARFGCTPSDPPAQPAALRAIEGADCIAIGPGSLYTSVIPNLLVPEIRTALATASAPRVYICNIMTQPGETDGYSVADHVRAIDCICGERLFDAVLVHRQTPSQQSLQRYAQQNAYPVELDREELAKLGRRLVLANVMDEDPQTGYVRHNPQRVARALLRWYTRAAKAKQPHGRAIANATR